MKKLIVLQKLTRNMVFFLGVVDFEEENYRCIELDQLYKTVYKIK